MSFIYYLALSNYFYLISIKCIFTVHITKIQQTWKGILQFIIHGEHVTQITVMLRKF